MSALRGFNIVHFYGACLEPRLCIAMEYCSRGSLHTVMSDRRTEMTWKRIFQFSKDMTAALIVLHNHNPPVFHRDMKSLNLLVFFSFSVYKCARLRKIGL